MVAVETSKDSTEDVKVENEVQETVTEAVQPGPENLTVATQPKYEPCPEDDDFLAALDKMKCITFDP